MHKDVLTTQQLIIEAIGAILVGSLCFDYTNAYASTLQQPQACADKFIPQNTTEYDICIGGMKSGQPGFPPTEPTFLLFLKCI